MNDIRILFAASRAWPLDRASVIARGLDDAYRRALDARGLRTWNRVPTVLVSGACPDGGDPIAEGYADYLGWAVERHPALWDECGPGCPATSHRIRRRAGDTAHPGVLPDYCPKAGPRRNTHMVSLGADQAVGFPLGTRWSGTRDCMAKAARAGIPTLILPEGTNDQPDC